MSGTATYLGSKTLGACVPIAAEAQAGLAASAALALPELTAKFEGLLKVALALNVAPPALVVTIRAMLAAVAALQATTGGATVTLEAGGIAAVIAELQASIGQIEAMIALAASIAVTLGAPGIELYRYDGTADGLPAAFDPEFTPGMRIGGGPNLPIHGILLVATDSGAWAVMQAALAAS